MTFKSPFLEGTKAQNIINNYLDGTSNAFAPFPSPSQNPYVVGGTPFVPPSSQPTPDPTIPNCDELYPNEGRVYDPVLQACVLPEVAPDIQDGNGDDSSSELDPNQALFNQMKKDPTTIFGASNILSDYVLDTDDGNITLKFDPSIGKLPPIFGLGLLDTIFGGDNRRLANFTKGMQSYMDQGYGQYNNDGTYQIYTPEQYYNTVKDNQLGGLNDSGGASTMTVGQAVDSVMNPTPQSGTSEGSPIAQDLSGGLLGTAPLTTVDSQGNRSRNDTAYRAAVARNIERNKRNNPYGVSGFKEGVGFTRGR